MTMVRATMMTTRTMAMLMLLTMMSMIISSRVQWADALSLMQADMVRRRTTVKQQKESLEFG